MTMRYAIRDYQTQQYRFTEDKATAITFIAQQAFEVYLNHFNHGNICSVVDAHEDGSMTWYTPTGERTPSPEEIMEELRKMTALVDPFIEPAP